MVTLQELPDVTEWGWLFTDDSLIPRWLTLEPVSEALSELKHCGCKKGCAARCSCKAVNLPCTEMCTCNGECLNVVN